MNLSRLDVFAKVVATGSLTRAAVLMDSTSSALSRQMTLLEQECGGRLFHRTGRGVVLTDLGQRMVPRVQSLLQKAEGLSQEIKGNAGVPAGEVRLGILAGAVNALLAPLYLQLHARHPAVRLRVIEGSSGQLDEWISTGHVDVALLARQSQALPPGEQPLATAHSHLVGPAGDPLTQQPTIDFAALHRLPLIMPGLPNGMRRTVEQTLRQRGLELNLVMEVDSLLGQLALVGHRCGYAVLPRHAVGAQLRAGTLTAAQIVNPDIARTVTLASTTQRPASLAGREVARLIRAIAQGHAQEAGGLWAPAEL